MATIIKLSQNEWVMFFCANGGDGWWEPIMAIMSEKKLKMADSEMAKFKMTEFRLPYEWEWMSLSQNELVWVRVRVKGECFWVNLREENKVSESKMQKLNPRWQNSRWPPIIKLSQNEWGWSQFFLWIKRWCLKPTLQCLNLRWQNSRWLPSSSWVRMNEFESVWISLSQSQSKGRVFLSESERRKQGVWIPRCRSWIHKMAEFKMAEFKMAAIIKWMKMKVFLSQSQSGNQSLGKWVRSWEKIARCLNPRWQWLNPIQDSIIQDGCHHQVQSEWMSDVFCAKWLKPSWENSRWLSSSSSVRMNEFESDWISLSQSQSGGRVFLSESERRKQGVWIPQMPEAEFKMEDFKMATYHQVEWEWMSLSQNELVWVRVRVEVECFWVNLREENKVSESKMAVAESK